MRVWTIGVLLSVSALPAWATSGQDGINITVSKVPPTTNISLNWAGGVAPYSIFRSTTPVDVTTQLSYLGTSNNGPWVDNPPAGGIFFYYVEGQCSFQPEVCDGVDNDCDPATPDGSQDPQIGAACDGPDGDSCLEGTKSCAAGSLACSDATNTTPEICFGDGQDEDCDGTVDEGFPINTNPLCPTFDYLGSIAGDLGAGSISMSGHHEAWFRVNLVESTSGIYDISAAVVLYSPPGTDFDLYVRCLGCSGGANNVSTDHSLTGHIDNTFILRHDTERIDTFPVIIEIRNYASSYCGQWQLLIQGNSGGPYESCPNP
jgi:hypothetical protein